MVVLFVCMTNSSGFNVMLIFENKIGIINTG